MTWSQKLPAFAGEDGISKLITFQSNLFGSTYYNGKLLKWDGVAANWVEVAGQFIGQTGVSDLIIFNSELYGCTNNGYLFKWDEVSSWINVSGTQVGAQLYKLIVYNNKIYTAGANGKLYEWSGTALIEKAPQLDSQVIRSLCVYNNKLYAGTHQGTIGGRLFEWNDVNTWIQVAPVYSTAEVIWDLIIFGNKLYGCTGSPSPGVSWLLQWNDLDTWIEIDQSDSSDLYTMEIVDNVLYICGVDDDLFKLDSGSLVKLFEGSSQSGISSLHLYTKDYKMYGGGFGLLDSALMDSSIQGTPPTPPNVIIKDKFANQGDILIGL